jgi:hypothetical protein
MDVTTLLGSVAAGREAAHPPNHETRHGRPEAHKAYSTRGGNVPQEKRVFDQGRATHSVEAYLLDEHCNLCGQPATHALAEQQYLTPRPMTTSLCCEHFTLVVDDCSYYLYDLPQPA